MTTFFPLALPGGSVPRAKGFIERPDCRVYYEVTGKGPVLVFAHGLGGNHLSWWQQVGHFAGRYTCVTFSHRGFAPSTAPFEGPDPAEFAADLAALLDGLHLDAPVFIGQSMGGWTGIDFALAHPGRLKGLVLSATSGAIDPRQLDPAGQAALAAWQAKIEPLSAENQAMGVHPAVGKRGAMEQPAMHFLYRAVDELSVTLDKSAMRQKLFGGRDKPPSLLSRIETPTLWLTGAEDVVFPSPVAPIMAGLMPKARHLEFPEAGHSAYFERPADFNAALEEFLAELGH
ncbi:alpha/beta hydrolase [Acetobacteraceae bacterium H6797]|nr:alpha/beta hydrolase [Acetobacteraceae bacterium H6797]